MTNTGRGRSVDVADLSLGANVIDHDRGEPDHGLVTENHVLQANTIFAHTDSGIEEVQDLEGKTIGIHSQSSASVIYSLGIASELYDVDLSTVNWVNQAIPELWGLIQDGQIDATVLFADFWYLGQQHEDIVEIFNTNTEWEEWVGGTTIFQILVARPNLIDNNPGLDVDLVNSLRNSRAYRNENLDETLELWIESTDADVSLDFLKRQAINLDVTFDLTEGDRATIDKFVELANEQGVVDSTPSVDDMFSDTVDEVGHVDCYRNLDTTLDC
jgi:ABC-type nitrate/sulfonate/bicarbonate transport system substrate-binding protein